MAVNSHSDLEVIRFYQRRFPMVFWQIKANEVHSLLVRRLAQQYPEVGFVDSQPGLDGEHDKFIDVAHFAEDGERQLAENIFAGIEEQLKQDLAEPVNEPGTNKIQAVDQRP
jgi:hypothetical protein